LRGLTGPANHSIPVTIRPPYASSSTAVSHSEAVSHVNKPMDVIGATTSPPPRERADYYWLRFEIGVITSPTSEKNLTATKCDKS